MFRRLTRHNKMLRFINLLWSVYPAEFNQLIIRRMPKAKKRRVRKKIIIMMIMRVSRIRRIRRNRMIRKRSHQSKPTRIYDIL